MSVLLHDSMLVIIMVKVNKLVSK